MQVTVAQYLAMALKSVAGDTVFGIPSYVGMRLIDALDNEKFQVILSSHEQNAAHAAEGYYYATGKAGIVALAMGPGLTNAITGIANAYIESVPMFIIAGRPTTKNLGRNEYHANSGIGRTMNEKLLIQSSVKASLFVTDTTDIVEKLNFVINQAIQGRPGPVYISIPPEIQIQQIEIPQEIDLNGLNKQVETKIDPQEQSEFVKLVNSSQKPLFIFGKELPNNSAIQHILSEFLQGNAPYFTSYAAKGKVPLLPNYMGTTWYDNSQHIAQACKEADLIIAFGEEFTAFSYRPFAEFVENKIIQIHSDKDEVGRCFTLRKGIVGNALDYVNLISSIKKPWPNIPQQQVKDSETFEYIEVLNSKLKADNFVYFADVGNAGYESITTLNLYKNQEFYTTGKNGICGFSIPAAIGYGYARKDKMVLSLVGDLAFVMNMQEVMNIKHLGTKNSIIIFNNHVPQNIYVDQIEVLNKHVQCDMPKVDLEGIAKFARLNYVKFETADKFADWLDVADFNTQNYLIELVIDKNDRPLNE